MADMSKIHITIMPDGPYAVHPDLPLDQAFIDCDADGNAVSWRQGRRYEGHDPEKPYNLCRCGKSKTRPYCDGTHNDAGFCGNERPERAPYAERARHEAGPVVGLLDDEDLCVGARFCDRGATAWRLVKSAEPGAVKEAMQQACDCPSGRLTVVDESRRQLEPTLAPSLSLIEDPVNNCRGPLWVKGGVVIENHTGERYETRNRVTLCRCGESENMPFCDARHYDCPHMQGLDD